VLLGVHWPAAVVFALVWITVAVVWRYSSLASLGATAGVIVYYLIFGQAGLFFILIIAALIVFKHQANIRRLLDGAETRIGAKP
jgi:acyl phosphate:glycerol-3-phosphate acyltransferase